MLNAWGEKDLFGQRIPKGFPLMLLVYPEDQDRLREAFNMVRRGRPQVGEMHLFFEVQDSTVQDERENKSVMVRLKPETCQSLKARYWSSLVRLG